MIDDDNVNKNIISELGEYLFTIFVYFLAIIFAMPYLIITLCIKLIKIFRKMKGN